MNDYLTTYIDFIQSIGFTFLTTMTFLITRKLFLDKKKDDYIEAVKINVEE